MTLVRGGFPEEVVGDRVVVLMGERAVEQK